MRKKQRWKYEGVVLTEEQKALIENDYDLLDKMLNHCLRRFPTAAVARREIIAMMDEISIECAIRYDPSKETTFRKYLSSCLYFAALDVMEARKKERENDEIGFRKLSSNVNRREHLKKMQESDVRETLLRDLRDVGEKLLSGDQHRIFLGMLEGKGERWISKEIKRTDRTIAKEKKVILATLKEYMDSVGLTITDFIK